MFADVSLVEAQQVNAAVQETTSTIVQVGREVASGNVHALIVLLERFVLPGGLSLLILVVAYFIARYVARIVQTPICLKVDETLGKFVGRLVFYGIIVAVVIWRLSAVGINVTSFTALLAAAGFAIGLAFQGTLSNFAAGVLLLVFRPFKVGDLIVTAGMTGKINEIDLFTTTLDTPDNRRIIVPNSAIAGSTIENVTHHKHRRIDVVVGVSYAASIDQTRETLVRACESLKDVLVEGENRGFQILLTGLNTSSVDWTIRFWANTKDFHQVREKVIAAAKNHLDQAGIRIPFPQMDVHLHQAATHTETSEEAHGVHRLRPRKKEPGPVH